MSDDLEFEIFVCINECAYRTFQNSMGSEYYAWCKSFSNQLKMGNITNSFSEIVKTIGANIKMVFGLKDSETQRLIINFFLNEEYKATREFTRLSTTLFGGYWLTRTNNKFKFKKLKKKYGCKF
jgi:hypothetical protein